MYTFGKIILFIFCVGCVVWGVRTGAPFLLGDEKKEDQGSVLLVGAPVTQTEYVATEQKSVIQTQMVQTVAQETTTPVVQKIAQKIITTPSVSAREASKAYGVYQPEWGWVQQKNIQTQYPIASITKLMTAIVVKEYFRDDVVFTIPKEAVVYTSTPRLVAGETILLSDALLLLLTESSNESARTISFHIGEEQFVGLMNATAQTIGMRNTYFFDASGSSEKNVSTVEDVAVLADYLLKEHGEILALTKKYGAQGSFENLENYNSYEKAPSFIGGKIGKTRIAGETMLVVFLEEGQPQRILRVYVVLGSTCARCAVDELRK